MKKELKRLNDLIKSFEKICEDYPLCSAYKDILNKLHNDRAVLVTKIGRK